MPDIDFAQELFGYLGKYSTPKGVLIGISTSGNAKNVNYAVMVAKAKGIPVIGLTGPGGRELARVADISVKAPGSSTASVQENHILLYHLLCRVIEAHYFPEER